MHAFLDFILGFYFTTSMEGIATTTQHPHLLLLLSQLSGQYHSSDSHSHMASVPLYPNTLSKDKAMLVPRLLSQSRTSATNNCIAIEKTHRCCLHSTKVSMPFQTKTRLSIPHALSSEESKETYPKDGAEMDKHCEVLCGSESGNTEDQVKVSDSYLNKLQNKAEEQQISFETRDYDTIPVSEKSRMETFPESVTKTMDLFERKRQLKAKKELSSLEDYFSKLGNELKPQKNISTFDDETTEELLVRPPNPVGRDYGKREEQKTSGYVQLGIKSDEPGVDNHQSPRPQHEASDLYLICMLAAINIAVFLFEIATPVKDSHLELFTLPSLYGAKINQLIIDGEWWRLVTPMFLHSGIFHVALGCWVLLTFGPQVCKRYGSFTFFLIYMLGGIAGNLTSFIHTPEPTVGGTGPIFAIIGAWLIYEVQNKEVIAKEVSESMFHKAVTATALSFVLSNFGPIDDWTHLGATFAGIAYGFLVCPTLQLDNTSSKNGPEEGFALARRHADPWKSIITFTIFIITLCSLFFFLEPQVIPMENSLV